MISTGLTFSVLSLQFTGYFYSGIDITTAPYVAVDYVDTGYVEFTP